jgi:hypothetical protein
MEITALPLPAVWDSTGEPSTTLHTVALSTEYGRSSHIALQRTYRKHGLHHHFCCCLSSPLTHKLRAIHSKGCRLQSHLLATGLYATLYLYLHVNKNFTYLSPYFPLTHCFPTALFVWWYEFSLSHNGPAWCWYFWLFNSPLLTIVHWGKFTF